MGQPPMENGGRMSVATSQRTSGVYAREYVRKVCMKTKTGKASPQYTQRLIVIIFSIIVIIILCTSVFNGLCETGNKNQPKLSGIVCHPGLYAKYYSVTNNYSSPTYNDIVYKAWQVDTNIDFNWGTGEPTDTYVGTDHFFVRWEGYLKINVTESYLFYVDHDNGVRVWFDNNLIIDNWTNTVERNYNIMNNIDAGYHPIKVEFFDNTGNAKIVFSWIKMCDWDVNVSVEDLPENPISPDVFRQDDFISWYQTSETTDLSSTSSEDTDMDT
ncbi:MAG: PA14 domain-containing protein, partial [Thermoplasmatales archaeon]|nr:PA14 domain-containing protein [Thermoplasmatales archaeon]